MKLRTYELIKNEIAIKMITHTINNVAYLQVMFNISKISLNASYNFSNVEPQMFHLNRDAPKAHIEIECVTLRN